MSDPYTDARPIWMQAAEQSALERAMDDAIAAELEETSFDEHSFDEGADAVDVPVLHTPCRSLPRRRGTSCSPSRLTVPDGAASARQRAALPPTARSP